MAYIGVNKAQNESSKFLIDEQANINAFGTVLNTASQVGQAIYSDIKTSQAQDLNRKLSEEFQKVDQEVYGDSSIPPEKRKDVLNERYTTLLDEAKANKKTLPGVFKMLSSNAKERVSKIVENWNAEDFQLALKAKDASIVSMLDSFVTTNDIVTEVKTTGWVKDKDYASVQNDEPMDFTEGFIGNAKQGVPVQENEDSLFDPDMQSLAYSEASEFDIRVAAITKAVKQLYPNNADLQKLTIEQYTNKLRDAVPTQDLELNFSKAFSESDPSAWGSYSEFYKSYAKELDTIQYGGKPVTSEKKRQLLSNLDTMWKGLNARVDTAATEIYNNEIVPVIQELRNAQAINSNSLYTTEDVNKAFDAALQKNPGMAKFIIEERENQLTVAKNNERIIQQRQFKELYITNGERSDEQEQKFFELSKMFSDDEIATLKQQALVQAGNVEAMREFEKSGVSYRTQADTFNEALRTVESSTFGSREELDRSLEQYEGVLGRDQIRALQQAGDSKLGRSDVYNAEAMENAGKELSTQLYRGTLSAASVSEVGKKYGLTVEDNPEFFSSWKNQTDLTTNDNARKMFNSLDFDDSITVEQVKSIAGTFGLGTDSDLYKNMTLKAEQNWQKHLDTIGATSQGFAENTTEEALSSVGAKIADFSNGKVSKSDALTYLQAQRGNLSETDYKNKFNQINNEYLIKKTTSDAIFEDKIFKPFMQDSKTIMPGDTDKRMREAGLNPEDYARDTDYLQMKDTESLNQHAMYVDQYTDNQMYLALRERGLSDASIRELGLTIPDLSFQKTLVWMNENKGTKPQTTEEYARQLVSEASSKMIRGTLPSGTKVDSATSVNGLSKAITESADRIQKDLVAGMKVGARYDNVDAVRDIELAKFTMEDNDFDAFAYRQLMDGKITEKSYLSYIAEDVSVFKGPEYKQFQDALEMFSGYVKEEASYYYDNDDNKIKHDSILIDSTVNGYKAAFLQEYQREAKNANGAPVNANDIAKRVYDRMRDAEYSQIANSVLDIAHMDNMNMYEGLFGTNEGVNFKAYQDYAKGISPSFDEARLGQLLNDPSVAGASYGVDSGGVSKWLGMYDNNADAKTVGNQIVYDVAKHMGFTPPPLDGDFERNFQALLGTLSPYTKSQLTSAVSTAKWATDIVKFAKAELPDDMVKNLDKDGNIVPVFVDRKIGVQIGETILMFDEGGKRGNASFKYITSDKNLKSLETKKSVYENAQKNFSLGVVNAFDQLHIDTHEVIQSDGDNITVNKAFLVERLNVELENRKEDLKGVADNYVSVVNKRSIELEESVGMTQGRYSGVEYFVDEAMIDAATKDGSILRVPLSSFIGSKLIPAVQ
ncbi:hypothetical protein [Sphaerochaeta globosa]|uniref:Uncharacterized protein n=1 Tax=Sphaerochaeta globosa (strain ATCC BAA-1886 / DSM 22777 / Buddy) TaxID=158189 RepID=F0RWQ9_SPHGB|nr:hypothetical protein [Sphaerochaeta globosa]ADY13690.1 hypothetical protein SpiBuddy_1866 [Sphaerochaeta globosa str. Buddy]